MAAGRNAGAVVGGWVVVRRGMDEGEIGCKRDHPRAAGVKWKGLSMCCVYRRLSVRGLALQLGRLLRLHVGVLLGGREKRERDEEEVRAG